MTSMKAHPNAIIEHYCALAEAMATDGGMFDGGKVVSLTTVRELLTRALNEYERMNSHPKVDFWGQPINE